MPNAFDNIINAFKKILKLKDLDGEEEVSFGRVVKEYETIVTSSKYTDSHANTQHLQRLVAEFAEPAQDEVQTPPSPKPDLEAEDQIAVRRNFKSLCLSHQQLMDELESESPLPAQPIHEQAAFGKKGGNNFRLKMYSIPKYIYHELEAGAAYVKATPAGNQLDPDNYHQYFQRLVWLEEAWQAIQMRTYDIYGAMIGRFGNDFVLQVPGLAEGRPSLMRGDKLIIKSPQRVTTYEGFIFEVRENDVIIRVHETLSHLKLDGLRFDIFFMSSRTTARRCHNAVEQVRFQRHLKDLTFPIGSPASGNDMKEPLIDFKESLPDNLRCFMFELNVYQRRAVMNSIKAVCRPAPFIIFGPPGTGKSVTMTEAVLQVYGRMRDSRVLVCASSNACADLLARAILKSKVVPIDKLVRVTAFYRIEKLVPEDLKVITLDMDGISSEMYENYRIVVTTCVQAGCLNEFNVKFDYVFIDEAGHTSEPEALIPIGLMKKGGACVLAGDPHQLGPVVLCPKASAQGLGTSFLERLFRRAVYSRQPRGGKMSFDERYLSKLLISYRCDRRILQVNNKLFYDNELESEVRTPKEWMELFKFSSPLVFHHVQGKDRREHSTPSWFNPNELIQCLIYVKQLYDNGLRPEQLGIITPYRRQIEKIQTFFESCKFPKCKIATMEEFQGDEREVIIISTVRSKAKNVNFDKRFNLGFLFNPKRFNVAISRAKWLVIAIGDKDILKQDPCWDLYMQAAHLV